MSARTRAIAIVIAAAAAPAVFAQSASVFVGGERGWIDLPVQSSLSREQVRSDFLQFRANPVAADGGRFVGGEAGYVVPARTYARVSGQWVCTDKIAHKPEPGCDQEQHGTRAVPTAVSRLTQSSPARSSTSPRSSK